MACLALDNLYLSGDINFSRTGFAKWNALLEIGTKNNFLTFNDREELCISCHVLRIPLYYKVKIGKKTSKHGLTKVRLDNFVLSIKEKLRNVAKALSAELRDTFPRDELLEAMGIIYPQFWNNSQSQKLLLQKFQNNLSILMNHFGNPTKVEGVTCVGILNSESLLEQSGCFGETMWNQFNQLQNPLEDGIVTRLWNHLSVSTYMQDRMAKYFKLANLCQTLILGSVEDERVFSLMSFVKSKLINKLDNNLDTCLRLYMSRYCIQNFPYDRVIAQGDLHVEGEVKLTLQSMSIWI